MNTRVHTVSPIVRERERLAFWRSIANVELFCHHRIASIESLRSSVCTRAYGAINAALRSLTCHTSEPPKLQAVVCVL